MRIGYVLKYFPKLSETFVLHEMVAMERAGAAVDVFAFRPSDGARYAPAVGELGAAVHYLDTLGSAELFARLGDHAGEVGRLAATRVPWLLSEVGRSPRPGALLRRTVELALRVRERRVDHLHAHFAGPAAEVARLVGGLLDVPFSFTCHAKDIYHDSVDPEAFARLADAATAVVTVCRANRRHVLEHLAPRAHGKLHVLYNGVDLDRFHPRGRWPASPPLVLGVGRLVAKKGFEYLIDAMARLEAGGHRVECVIAGEGRERERLQSRLDASGCGSVSLVGPARHDEVRALLSRASVLVLPCVVDEEGNRDALPTVLLEALAAGVPVVSTPVTGVGEIVDHGVNGLLVPERDSAALAAAVSRILSDPALATAFSAAGRTRAEGCFDLERSARTLLAILAGEAAPEAVA